MDTKTWTGISLLREAYNRLTPKNWGKGDYRQQDFETGREMFCIVGMCAEILGFEDNPGKAEDFLYNYNLPVSSIEMANDDSSSLAELRKKLSEILEKPF